MLGVITLLAEQLPSASLGPARIGAVVGPSLGTFIFITQIRPGLGSRRILLVFAVNDLLMLGLSVVVAYLLDLAGLFSAMVGLEVIWLSAAMGLSIFVGSLTLRFADTARHNEDGGEAETGP